MAKIQTNFSWQKYDGNEKDQQEQFQYQLQNQFIQISNSINATIDDESFFTRERQTSFLWVNQLPIWKVTVPIVSWTVGGTVNVIPLPIKLAVNQNFTIINMTGFISNGTTTLVLPNVGVTATDGINMAQTGLNVTLTSGGTDYSAYSGYITVYYYKS
jgi:hypothetical protein